MTRERILVDASTLDGNPSGAATRLPELYRAYGAQYGLDRIVFLIEISRAAARQFLPEGASFIERRCPRTPTERLVASSIFFAGLVEELQLKAVHVEGLPPPTLDAAVVVTVHDLRFRSAVEKSVARRVYASFLLRERLRRSIVVAVSRCVAAELESWLKPLDRYLWLVPNAATTPTDPPLPSRGEPFVLVLGHLERRKAPDTALRTIAAMGVERPAT